MSKRHNRIDPACIEAMWYWNATGLRKWWQDRQRGKSCPVCFPAPIRSDQDERVVAWEAVAKHPLFVRCYDEERPLLHSMLDLLDSLSSPVQETSMDVIQEFTRKWFRSEMLEAGGYWGDRFALNLAEQFTGPTPPAAPEPTQFAPLPQYVQSLSAYENGEQR